MESSKEEFLHKVRRTSVAAGLAAGGYTEASILARATGGLVQIDVAAGTGKGSKVRIRRIGDVQRDESLCQPTECLGTFLSKVDLC